METRTNLGRREARHLEDLRIRQEIDDRAGLLRFPDHGQEPLHELKIRLALRIMVVMNCAVALYLHVQIGGQGVHDRGADAVQAAGCLVGVIVEFAAGVQGRIDQPLGGDTLFVHADRDPAAVILDCAGPVFLQSYIDMITVSGQVLVHRVVHDLVNQVIETLPRGGSDVHSGTAAHRLEPLQDLYAACIVNLFLSHSASLRP